ncbi:MAG: hypothetical protein HYY06_13155 [Deltaproteobacteria bacterium]|nr:hypothetical protein [Deltaproteobacteria bacterium]
MVRIAEHPTPPLSPAPGSERARVCGAVRALSTAPSPLSGAECVAFRLVGSGPSGHVDDSGMGSFEVVVDGSETIAVESGSAVVDVPAGRPAQVQDLPAALAEFLEHRGVLLSPGPISVAEGLVRDGDHVEIEGIATADVRPDGYRGVARRTLLRGNPEAPLIIRLART